MRDRGLSLGVAAMAACAALGPMAAGTAGAGAPADPIPHGGTIAFASYRYHGTLPGIVLMHADGSHKHVISPHGARDDTPDISPSGRRVAFSDIKPSNGRIGIMRADGSHRQLISSAAHASYAPAFSPGGKQLAFYSFRNRGRADIYTERLAGSVIRRLTHTGSFDEDPAYSPDGRLIAYDSDREGRGNFRVWVMRRDGTHKRPVSKEGDEPSFSPDAGRVVYAGIDGHGLGQIYTVRPDGHDRVKLTQNTGGRIEYGYPTYSQDGTRIVFERDVVFRNFSYSDIFRMNANGSHVVRLSHGKLASEPTWGASAR